MRPKYSRYTIKNTTISIYNSKSNTKILNQYTRHTTSNNFNTNRFWLLIEKHSKYCQFSKNVYQV